MIRLCLAASAWSISAAKLFLYNLADALQRVAHMVEPGTVVGGPPEAIKRIAEFKGTLSRLEEPVADVLIGSELRQQGFVHLSGVVASEVYRVGHMPDRTYHTQGDLVPVSTPCSAIAFTKLDHICTIWDTANFAGNVLSMRHKLESLKQM